MKIKAFAKVNLALDVVSKRDDGYHELEMIMAPITLHDLIIINKAPSDITLTTNSYRIPTDERNIMYKVAKLMIERFNINSGIKMHVYKHIPSQAGLAGGSADGAAVIKAINIMYHLNLSYKEMAEIGKEVGADIPFCIYNKLSLVKGIGEKITFLDNKVPMKLLLVKPKKGVSTKKAFNALDLNNANHPQINNMIEAFENDDYEGVVNSLGNTLEKPSMQIVKDIENIKKELIEFGFDGALMSGSGSTVFGITQDEKLCDEAIEYFRDKYPFVRKTEIMM